MKRVLFLCTGNYYRSRFAEAYFNSLAQAQGLGWHADSCGFEPAPQNVGPISQHTLEELIALGIQHGDGQRWPRKAQACDFESADLIIAVKEAEHRALVVKSFPDWLPRFEFWQVHDLDCAEPEETIADLKRLVGELADRLAAQDADSSAAA